MGQYGISPFLLCERSSCSMSPQTTNVLGLRFRIRRNSSRLGLRFAFPVDCASSLSGLASGLVVRLKMSL